MSTITDKAKNAANSVADAAQGVAHKVADNVSEGAALVKDKLGIGCDKDGPSVGVNNIRERMEVFASCGSKVGVVDHIEGSTIKLTRNDSPDGQHHFIPTDWVGRVHENHVHLRKNSVETKAEWKPDAASCGCS